MQLEGNLSTPLEATVATLHNAKFALTFTSRKSAVAMVTYLYKPDGSIVVGQDVSEDAMRLFNKILPPRDIVIKSADTSDIENYRDLMPGASALYIKTGPNPETDTTDISAAARLAHDAGAILIIENNERPPYSENPLDLGADIVIENAAQYIDGTDDISAGFMVTNDPKLYEFVKTVRSTIGTELSLHSSHLLENSLAALKLSAN